MYYLTFFIYALILGNVKLQRTVGNEKPFGDYLFHPILTFGDMFNEESGAEEIDKGNVENLQEQEFPEAIKNLEEIEESISSSIQVNEPNEYPHEIANTEMANDNSKDVITSNDANADEDEDVCHNETSYSSIGYITQVLLNANIIDHLMAKADYEGADTVAFQLLNNLKDTPLTQSTSTDVKGSDLLAKLLLSVETEMNNQRNSKPEEDLPEIIMHNNLPTSNPAAHQEVYSNADVLYENDPENQQPHDVNSDNTSSDEEPSPEDIGKVLKEGDLFDYGIFVDVYLQQVVECSVATVNVTRLTDLPNGLFEAIDIVHTDLMNKLNLI